MLYALPDYLLENNKYKVLRSIFYGNLILK